MKGNQSLVIYKATKLLLKLYLKFVFAQKCDTENHYFHIGYGACPACPKPRLTALRKLGMVVHSCNPSTQEVEEAGSESKVIHPLEQFPHAPVSSPSLTLLWIMQITHTGSPC